MTPDARFSIVDASRNFHHVMRGILRSLGFRRVDSFVDGRDARDFLATTICDMAFVDVTLGDGSGIDFVNALRHDRLANPAMPIVILTSMTSRRNIEQAMASGADYVLAKPISPKILGQRIPALMSRANGYIHTATGYFGPDPKLGWRKSSITPPRSVAKRGSGVRPMAPREHHRDAAFGAVIDDDDLVFLD